MVQRDLAGSTLAHAEAGTPRAPTGCRVPANVEPQLICYALSFGGFTMLLALSTACRSGGAKWKKVAIGDDVFFSIRTALFRECAKLRVRRRMGRGSRGLARC